MADGTRQHVLVKFSGSDNPPGTQRWADLLVCEHLAGGALEQHAATARSRVYAQVARTSLQVDRFDRRGTEGRSAMVSLSGLNNAIGSAGPLGAGRAPL